jgi:hypothetical protein
MCALLRSRCWLRCLPKYSRGAHAAGLHPTASLFPQEQPPSRNGEDHSSGSGWPTALVTIAPAERCHPCVPRANMSVTCVMWSLSICWTL